MSVRSHCPPLQQAPLPPPPTHTPSYPHHSPSTHKKKFTPKNRARQDTSAYMDAQKRANKNTGNTASERDRLAEENGQLRSQLVEREADLKVYSEAVAELKGEVEDYKEDLEELENRLRLSEQKCDTFIQDLKDSAKRGDDLLRCVVASSARRAHNTQQHAPFQLPPT